MQEIEKKWQERWEAARIFEPSTDSSKDKFYLTAAFPYPNSPQHIGHGRTYTITDIYARYMRLKGKNVLFPMGFHVTGTPVMAMAKRIAEEDQEVIEIFEKIYGIEKDTIRNLTEPTRLVMHFSNEIESGMKEMGYSIDWRRKFYSNDAAFNKFIEWQFFKLMKKGYITKGEHPVPWCPVANTAIGAHDTKGDVDPEIEEMLCILFRYRDGFIVCATYRPETVYGVTNIWINENATYVKATDGKRKLYMSKDAVKELSLQLELKIEEEIAGKQLIGTEAKNPITDELVPILHADFVDPSNGSGAVMSVPAHAPYDYLALRDAGLEDKYQLKQVLQLDGFGPYPAKEICEKIGIKSQKDERAKDATQEIYKKEAHSGIMVCGEFKGLKGVEAKEKIKQKMLNEGKAFTIYEIANGPIYSRYGGKVSVKIVKDQWFIDYGNPEWKKKAQECLKRMKILPEKTRKDYEYTIDWLKQKACTRSTGLGTKFPFDSDKMIEALSDSTIYMAFYTIAHIAKKMKEEELTEELFDYVFLGQETEKKLPPQAKEMRREFEYWYPLDSRHSATDLVHNHLTFFIFNHTAIFGEALWPRQIVTNGFVLMDGKKMSKSMGNILPLKAAIGKWGADAVRLAIVSGADLAQDTDFNQPAIEGILARMKFLKSAMEKYAAKRDDEKKEQADLWLLSRLHRRCLKVDELYQNLQIRELTLELFYNTVNDLQWYLKRAKEPKLREFFEIWTVMVSPFIPHFAEEIWEKLGKKIYVGDSPFVSIAKMPRADLSKISDEIEDAEEYISKIKEDIHNIMGLLKKEKIECIQLFVAARWKWRLMEIVQNEKSFEASIKKAVQDEEIKTHAAEAQKLIQIYLKNKDANIKRGQDFELMALNSAVHLLETEFKCGQVVIKKEEETEIQKARNAVPGKPAILVV
ncbi:MAG: leucine--tRNA ligase [Candidatus Micrarchaeota archaeon]|nr:leucine--tRNA ligase [Candidatus Micrarchaeota archaeon]